MVGELRSHMSQDEVKTNKINCRSLMFLINPFLNFSSFILETSFFFFFMVRKYLSEILPSLHLTSVFFPVKFKDSDTQYSLFKIGCFGGLPQWSSG